MGYSQYLFLPLVRIAAATGVWGVSALVVFPSVFLGNSLRDGPRNALVFLRSHRIVAAVWAVVFVAALVFGFLQNTDFSDQRQWRVALIQQNIDPWHGGVRAYRNNLDILLRLSKEAEKSDPDVVIWSETAFVPGIDWHTRYRTYQQSYRLVRELTDYLKDSSIPYVIGNDDGQIANPALPPVLPDGTLNRVDYNAVLLYERGRIVDTYRKIRLVPFTESFPFEKQLPGIYRWLKNADTHFWEKGTEYTVFNADGVRFSTPICYEDTFGSMCRRFVREGAQVIANVSNDSWSQAVAAEMQHMQMAVLRAVENRRTVVRATNGGMTCTIEPDGKITAILEPFTEGYLLQDVPVYDATTTLYTRWGDWLGQAALIAALLLLAAASVRLLVVRRTARVSD
jgi:apolipoprotein N-acyltransferase